MSTSDVDRAIDGYEAAVQRQFLAMAQKRVADILRLRASVEALGGSACSNYDDGYNRAVIDAVALIDRALTEKSDTCDAVGCAEPALDSTADGERFCHDHMLAYLTPTPRFTDVHCSHCGQSFGPGDQGFSHCDQHRHLRGRS